MLARYVLSQVKHNSYFLVGLAIGLWVSLVAVPLEEPLEACASVPSAAPSHDDFEPVREERPLGGGGAGSARSIQRPRYYSTELGMRAPLLAGVLSSEDALGTKVAALNRTAGRLLPALRFFITASALQSAPGLTNVVGFTDTREMLKPFHILKYLADNYLEEYDFFFLVFDSSFVNARRLLELVSKLSVSQDVYMGLAADDDSHYCTLEGGILLSNSVLRSVHTELDWCVRNSYSPSHHDNIGRCVLHAARVACMQSVQGENYESVQLADWEPGRLQPGLAHAVTVQGLKLPEHYHLLHAYISRVQLELGASELATLRRALRTSSGKHPAGYRNRTWPAGLRQDPGLGPPSPDSRWDYLRWTAFNETHALLADDHHAVSPLRASSKEAVDMVVEAAKAWALHRWPAEAVEFVSGAWRWEPATALRYRLLLRLTDSSDAHAIRQVEVVRALGAARLVPVPYVTESARVTILLPVPAIPPGGASGYVAAAKAFLRRYDAICLQRHANTVLVMVIVRNTTEDESMSQEVQSLHEAVTSLNPPAGSITVLESRATLSLSRGHARLERTAGVNALAAAVAAMRTARDALVLVANTFMDFNEDFLNRVRMNTIMGEQWFSASAFTRYAHYLHPRNVDETGKRPQVHTGRFVPGDDSVVSFYRSDYDAALSAWREKNGPSDPESISSVLGSHLRVIIAPEPAAIISPRAPCGLPNTPIHECLRAERDDNFSHVWLGAPHSLAKMLLQIQADIPSVR